MLHNTRVLMSQGGIAIHPSFTKLIYFLRTATINQTTGAIDKANGQLQFGDIGDSMLMALKAYRVDRIGAAAATTIPSV
jgi:hypothetical protein